MLLLNHLIESPTPQRKDPWLFPSMLYFSLRYSPQIKEICLKANCSQPQIPLLDLRGTYGPWKAKWQQEKTCHY